MRTISAADEALFTAPGGRTERFRLKVKDSGGTYRDLTIYGGVDFVLGGSWKEDVDGNGLDASFDLMRAVEGLSLAPLIQASPLNRAFAYPGSYSPLLAVGREVLLEWSVVPEGTAPSTWTVGFHGYIDSIDPTGGKVKLECRGQHALLMDTFIERERNYAYAHPSDPDSTKGLLTWRPSSAIALNDLAVPTEANRHELFYKATSITTGITGATEPAWPTSPGGTVVDGGVTWTNKGATTITVGTPVETVLQQLISDHGLSDTITTPSSPSWLIRAYKQDLVSVWAALRGRVDQIAWDLRYWFNSGLGDFRLEFREPDRAKTTPDRTFGPADRFRLERLIENIDGVRNVVRVIYSDSSELGVPRKEIERSDATSITRYRRRFIGIQEADSVVVKGGTSNIDTSTEAGTLANNVLSDLKSPLAEQDCSMPFFPFAELGDLYRFSADGQHYDSAMDLAVVGYSHSFTGGKTPKARTKLTCRGRPAGGFKRWLKLDAGRTAEWHAFDLTAVDKLSIDTADVVGGTQISLGGTEFKSGLAREYEVHVSDTPGFTPSAATMVATGANTDVVLSDLVPGDAYYTRVIPYGRNASRIVRGQPSAELSFTAGRAGAGHIQEGIAVGDYPLNGGFETRLKTAGMPDHWTIGGPAVYGTNFIPMEDSNGVSGARYMRCVGTGVGGYALSAMIPVVNEAGEAHRSSGIYRVTLWVKNDAGNSGLGALEVFFGYYDSAGAGISASASALALLDNTKKGHWQLVEKYLTVDADTAIRAIKVSLELAGGAFTMDVDEIRCRHLGSNWYQVGNISDFTDAYESVPDFENGWDNYGSGQPTAAFRRDAQGRFWLQGLLKDGSTGDGNQMFTVPESFWPLTNLNFPVITDTGIGRLEVQADGNVVLLSGGTGFVSLEGISWARF